MKVLFITNKPSYPPIDGGTIGTKSVIEGLLNKGVELKVVTLSTYKHPFKEAAVPKAVLSKCKYEAIPINTRIKLLPLIYTFVFKKVPYIVTRFYSNKVSEKLAFLVKEESYDIIFIESIFLAAYVDLISDVCSSKVILRAPNVEYKIWQRVAKNASFLKGVYLARMVRKLERYEKEAFKVFDGIVTLTEKDKKMVQKENGQKSVFVAPIGIAVKNDKNYAHSQRIYFIGALDWLPNLEGLRWFLENVWDDLSKKMPQLEFHIAGKSMPPEISGIQRKNVFVHGEVEDAAHFMQEHGTMVVPLFSGSGMRVKIIEAMCNLSPVVSTTIGTEGINTIDGETILIADTKEAFVLQLQKLIADQKKAENLVFSASNFVKENYDNDRIMDKLYTYFENVLR